MHRSQRVVLEHRWIGVLATLGVAYAVLASFTHPFTWAANVVTAVPLAVAVLVTARSSAVSRPAEAGTPAVGDLSVARRWPRRGYVWIVLIAATLGWELYCLMHLPRAVHPTLSSLLDILDATPVGKTVAFASWLVLGWFLVEP